MDDPPPAAGHRRRAIAPGRGVTGLPIMTTYVKPAALWSIATRALREGIDTATPTGRAIAAIMATLAELELELELGRERRAVSRARPADPPATRHQTPQAQRRTPGLAVPAGRHRGARTRVGRRLRYWPRDGLPLLVTGEEVTPSSIESSSPDFKHANGHWRCPPNVEMRSSWRTPTS